MITNNLITGYHTQWAVDIVGDIIGAECAPLVIGNTITGNSHNGICTNAVWVQTGTAMILSNDIHDNGKSGIYLMDLPAKVSGNRITGNGDAGINSGGVIPTSAQIEVESNLVAHNGSGMLLWNLRQVSISSNTVTHNRRIGISWYPGRLPADGIIRDNIVAFNGWGVSGYQATVISHNDAFGNTNGNYGEYQPDPTGTDGNISVDPLFVDMAGGDYRLRWDSPCVDAGTNEGAPLWDILGNLRPIDGNLDGLAVTDMGAYEYVPVKVALDIVPGDASNTIPLQKNGMVTVAILGTPDFDIRSINPATTVFGPGKTVEVHGRGHMEDVNLDSRMDLLLHYRSQDIGLQPGTCAVSISGRLTSGEPFVGSDNVIVKSK